MLVFVTLISEYCVCSKTSFRAGVLFLFRLYVVFVISLMLTELFNLCVLVLSILIDILDGFLIRILSFNAGDEVKVIVAGLDT